MALAVLRPLLEQELLLGLALELELELELELGLGRPELEPTWLQHLPTRALNPNHRRFRI